MKHTAFVAVISHRHGNAAIVAGSKAQLTREIAEWCYNFETELSAEAQVEFTAAMNEGDLDAAVRIYFADKEDDEFLETYPPADYVDEFNPSATSDERWKDDGIQFMRLLEEINGLGLPDYMMKPLALNMDCTVEEIQQLFDRAQAQWDAYKETIPKL